MFVFLYIEDWLLFLFTPLTSYDTSVPQSIFPLVYSRKPLVCLFPALFKQNLLSFISLVHSVLPHTSVLHLLKCLSQDPHPPNPWVTALGRQLKRSLGVHTEEPLCTPLCSRRLSELSQRLIGSGETGGWAQCLSSHTMRSESQTASGSSEQGTQRKRKGSVVLLDSEGDDTMSQQSKRTKMDICSSECVHAEHESANEGISEKSEEGVPSETPADYPSDSLPEHIQVEAMQEMQEIFYIQYLFSFHIGTEWFVKHVLISYRLGCSSKIVWLCVCLFF